MWTLTVSRNILKLQNQNTLISYKNVRKRDKTKRATIHKISLIIFNLFWAEGI